MTGGELLYTKVFIILSNPPAIKKVVNTITGQEGKKRQMKPITRQNQLGIGGQSLQLATPLRSYLARIFH